MGYQDMDSRENPFLNTFRLSVKTPRSVKLAVIIVHVISIFLPWFSNLNIAIKILISVLALLSLAYYLFIYFFSSDKKTVSELVLNSEDKWIVKTKDGEAYKATLGRRQFVYPWLTIVSLKYGKKTGFFIFTPEVIDADSFRRLRVRLRYKIDYEE